MRACASGASLCLVLCTRPPPPTFSMQLVGGTLPIIHMRAVCVKVEQKNTKQSDVTRRITYHQNFLEGGKLVVGVASVVCVVSHRYPRFFDFMQEYCSRLLVLTDTFMFS